MLRRWSAALQCIPDIEKYLEVQLLSAICEVKRGHLRFVARFLRALKGFAVHLVQVLKDAITGAGHQVLYGRRALGKNVAVAVDTGNALENSFRIAALEEEFLRRTNGESAWIVRAGHRVELKSGHTTKEAAEWVGTVLEVPLISS